MKPLKVQYVEFGAGTHINVAIRESITLARRKDYIVKFKFNAVEMKIWSFSTHTEELEYYRKQLNEIRNSKVS